MNRVWEHRLDITDDDGLTRQQHRDRARATRKPSSPRKGAPVPSAVLCMAIRLKEKDLHDGVAGASTVQREGHVTVVSPDRGQDSGV